MAGRTWGIWTRGKLDVLRRYLDAFTTTTKNKAGKTVYIDAFAGQPENKDRLTDEPIDGSAKIALSIDDPPFTVLRFFETERNAASLERVLLSDFPDRDFRVLGGDSNELVPLELRRLHHLNWAPTFAFVDPNGMEAEWRTLEAIAAFKEGRKIHGDSGLGKTHLLEAIAAFKEGRKRKAEIFYLFSPPMFQRLLRVDGNEVRPQDSAAITAVFGTDDWNHIYQARLKGEIASSRAGDEYLNLMRWRMETVLDYRWTHPLEVRNERGRVIYHMIFTTDHLVGNEIMSDVYAQAAAEFPAMREEARRLRKQKELKDQGVMSLFDDDDWRAPAQPGERFYKHESPTRPWFIAEEE